MGCVWRDYSSAITISRGEWTRAFPLILFLMIL